MARHLSMFFFIWQSNLHIYYILYTHLTVTTLREINKSINSYNYAIKFKSVDIGTATYSSGFSISRRLSFSTNIPTGCRTPENSICTLLHFLPSGFFRSSSIEYGFFFFPSSLCFSSFSSDVTASSVLISCVG